MVETRATLRRVLGPRDVALFLIAAIVNLNSIPVVAGAGPAAMVFWAIGFFLFFIPQGVAVLELSRRSPHEGGIYNWTKASFGDFHAFISGWCYWTNNIFYVPTLLFYIIGFGTYLLGGKSGLSDDPYFMAGVSLLLLWGITAVNVRGVELGKWVQNVGAAGTFVTAAIIAGIAATTVAMRGMANPITVETVTLPFRDWHVVMLLSVVCMNYTGLDLASVMGDEIKDPRRVLPRAVVVAGISSVMLYTLATFSIQATIPSQEIGVIQGILQAVHKAAADIGFGWLVVPIAILMMLNAGGNTSAWLSGSSRIPFVIGLDRYLPAALGRIHPRYGTPHVSLVAQAIASGLFIVISSIGSSVHDMYMILLQTTIFLQLVPYLYMFGALIRVRLKANGVKPSPGYFSRNWVCFLSGAVGFIVTAGGVVLALVPPTLTADIFTFEFKLILGLASFLIPALIIYYINNRRRQVLAPIVVEIESTSD